MSSGAVRTRMDPRVACTAPDNNWLAYNKNKALLDHTSQALCTPITPGSDGMVRSAAA